MGSLDAKALVAALGPVLSNAAEGLKHRSRNADFSLGGKPRPGPVASLISITGAFACSCKRHGYVDVLGLSSSIQSAFLTEGVMVYLSLKLFLGLPQIAAIRTISV